MNMGGRSYLSIGRDHRRSVVRPSGSELEPSEREKTQSGKDIGGVEVL